MLSTRGVGLGSAGGTLGCRMLGAAWGMLDVGARRCWAMLGARPALSEVLGECGCGEFYRPGCGELNPRNPMGSGSQPPSSRFSWRGGGDWEIGELLGGASLCAEGRDPGSFPASGMRWRFLLDLADQPVCYYLPSEMANAETIGNIPSKLFSCLRFQKCCLQISVKEIPGVVWG